MKDSSKNGNAVSRWNRKFSIDDSERNRWYNYFLKDLMQERVVLTLNSP